MNAPRLKQKFIDFFLSKGHQEIPSASLIPENDPTTLFISAGMHPLVPFLLGTPHTLGKRLVDVQKCLRTRDIDEVGDTFHHTFFEMLGNWSLGDYFKKDMIAWSYEFLTKQLNLNPQHLHITCFAGDTNAPKDEQSAKFWRQLGIPESRIHFLPKKDNWWGPAGATGPCGPDSEMFIDTQPQQPSIPFDQACRQGRIIEIWNDVFMQYNKDESSKYHLLSQQNVDTGMGVERTVAILNGFSDNYLTDIWQPIIQKIEQLSSQKYSQQSRPMRIMADHIRSAVFIMAEGVEPSNKEAGYVLRRLIRRAIRQAKLISIDTNFTAQLATVVLDNQSNYAGHYPELENNRSIILELIEVEEKKFRQGLNLGLKQINKILNYQKKFSPQDAFNLYQNYGFPIEMTTEELVKHEIDFNSDDLKEFNHLKQQHQQKSRTLSAGKFKSGLADHSVIITQHHTATHLLHSALRQVLGPHVQQAGSNINQERLRFDFTHPQKMTDDQIKQVEKIVNQKIKDSLSVSCRTMDLVDVKKDDSIIAIFGAKYPGKVTVYSIGQKDKLFSKEVCTGPHVKNTSELGHFHIIKESSSSSGRRRIYAKLS